MWLYSLCGSSLTSDRRRSTVQATRISLDDSKAQVGIRLIDQKCEKQRNGSNKVTVLPGPLKARHSS